MLEKFLSRFDLDFADLYTREGVMRLDGVFLRWLGQEDTVLVERLRSARRAPDVLTVKEESYLLLDVAPFLERFIVLLFGIEGENEALRREHERLECLYECKRLFVQRFAARSMTREQAQGIDGREITQKMGVLLDGDVTELTFACTVMEWYKDEEEYGEFLEVARLYACWALFTREGRERYGGGVLFRLPRKLDPYNLVDVREVVDEEGLTVLESSGDVLRWRDGFDLTDGGTDLEGALDEANYCIWCHNQGKDSCSRGLKDRKTGGYREDLWGYKQIGCPLEQKISEMHLLKSRGYTIGALAMVTVDNPLCAATGHRICNDCMKACIFQKQQPVDTPQVETRVLRDVLGLSWGVEIYSLLTRWNPLNLRRPTVREESGYKVLVVGLGPAGFTLAHHLLNDGHSVVAIDGLKIEPLPEEISGVDVLGERVEFKPIREMSVLYERLSDRVMGGFGGVSEYGITVRWEKNFLKVVRLLLERRREFSMLGGVRFGGTLSIEDAWSMGFDHIALCMGAGRPRVVPMRGGLVRGVRQASDFLMALQLTGASRYDIPANLVVRLPIVVIGGGLTAIDTATEAQAYYVVQVEKFLRTYEGLQEEGREEKIWRIWSEEECGMAREFLEHARLLRLERERAREEGREVGIGYWLRRWGGSTIVYRRRLIDSPSYRLNPEEVGRAFEEGIRFMENVTPREVEVDSYGYAKGLRVRRADGGEVVVGARTVLVAAGTQPNTVLAQEDTSGEWVFDGDFFHAYDENGERIECDRVAKPSRVEVLLRIEGDGRGVSYFGDMHPSFAGNVVKAMGSAQRGHVVISRILRRRSPTGIVIGDLVGRMNRECRVVVHRVIRLTSTIVEVILRAPRAAGRFEPGQFYRLQNFEALSGRRGRMKGVMEGIALTGAWVDKERGLLSTIVLEMGVSSSLCMFLREGEPVVLMGPTGTPTEIPEKETVCLIGGGLGNAVLFSIGLALRRRGNRVLYFAGYRSMEDRYKVEQIEEASDFVVWCCDEGPGFECGRVGDRSFVGNLVEGILAYGEGRLGETAIGLQEVDRMIVIGSDRMMGAIKEARKGILSGYFRPDHCAVGSINSPMQCMMKAICGQCLQIHHNTITGEEETVFSCINQDQTLDFVDFKVLNDRLQQNAVQEKLMNLSLFPS